MKTILGVGGGIAAYKAAELCRQLVQRDAAVQVVMTRSAQEFVQPLTFAALSGRKVITGMFSSASSEDTLSSAVEHIAVAQDNDVLVVAPATADLLASFAHGLADDFLTTLYLAFTGPVVLAPAMNTAMWQHPATQANLEILRRRGHRIVEPGRWLSGLRNDRTRAPGRAGANCRRRDGASCAAAAIWKARPCWSPPDPRRKRSTRFATFPTVPAARWAMPSPRPPRPGARTSFWFPARYICSRRAASR